MDTTRPDTVIDNAYYSFNRVTSWENKAFKRMTMGIAYHADIIQNKVMILVPFDLEFLTLFDRRQDFKIALHTGLEGWFINKICIRFGYAYAPEYIRGEETSLKIKSSHLFAGGAGARFEHVSGDMYVQPQGWGIGVSIFY
jgi:hypothetical protein